jgi:ribonuclease BN (tRNA processing enzyme)
MDFIRDADLLIADAQYTEDEYPQKVGWGHSSVPLLLEVAFKSHVKQLAIFHHDPQHSDNFLDDLWMKNRSLLHVKDQKMELFWAREGMTLAV